ncbi:helix-turn-helix transcriptional regulator [Pseudovibrio sp. WM33]|uniref:helix-turn-helix transcriptional regulator n=1 Tax=Pseudovibrio sp. WM33 TaxID=1735585 RepID=UPI0007B1A3B8|nr:LuxR family transcriptional regulator [Pseudovibrio sp. WM33]KZL29255.1 Transcriptional activator protein LasR [Pseudovibrio sp. WM33]
MMNYSMGYPAGFDRNLLQFSQDLWNCSSLQSRWEELTSFAEKLGFEKGAYIIVPKIEGRVEDRQPICLSNHADDWVDHYNSHHYYFKDPGMDHLLSGKKADQLWTDYTVRPTGKIDEDFFHDVRSAGLKFGVTIPVDCSNKHLVGGASFASCERTQLGFDAQMTAKYPILKGAVQLFHTYAQEPETLSEFFGFTPREHECLLWLTAGRANKEIAHILDLSEKTVEHHIKRACKKLRVTNRTHAVARAMTFQLLSP